MSSVATSHPAADNAGPSVAEQERRTMFRILLVDSDMTVCTSISRTLAGLGYGLDVAYDADEARRLAKKHHYAVGLFGEQLTDGDGVSLYAELRRIQRHMSGVLVATVANLYTVAKAVGAGMTRVLPVPLDFRDLVEFIATSQPQQSDAAARSNEPALDAVPPASPAFTEERIAELSPRDIADRMAIGDLIAVIRSVDYPFAGKDRLEFFDRDTLERVVHLVRRWCRNRLQRHAW
jgi:ActR/RegA family two-component response regulator